MAARLGAALDRYGHDSLRDTDAKPPNPPIVIAEVAGDEAARVVRRDGVERSIAIAKVHVLARRSGNLLDARALQIAPDDDEAIGFAERERTDFSFFRFPPRVLQKLAGLAKAQGDADLRE